MLRTVLSELAPLHEFEAMFAVSALKHHGCGALVRHLLSCARPAPWLLPADRAADRGPIAQAMAATQGAMFERLHAELPYSISLRHVSWTDFKDGSVRVEQTLVVPTPAVRKIVVGKDGSAIGQIGIAARKVCEEMFGRRVHLILNVKVARGRRASSAEGPDSMVDTFDDDGEGE
jgi:GTP-binding protein Era